MCIHLFPSAYAVNDGGNGAWPKFNNARRPVRKRGQLWGTAGRSLQGASNIHGTFPFCAGSCGQMTMPSFILCTLSVYAIYITIHCEWRENKRDKNIKNHSMRVVECLQEKNDNVSEWSYKYNLIILNFKIVHCSNVIVCEQRTGSVLLLQGFRNRNKILLKYIAEMWN
jgi:hypothetical protein